MDADVRRAVREAKKHLLQVFASEEITDVGLEEVEFDNTKRTWKITIGFTRPWDHKHSLATALGTQHMGRSYKVIRIDGNGHMVSIKDRILTAAR